MPRFVLPAAVIAALACAGPALAANETIAVFTKNPTNPYFQAVRVGAETAAKALGANVIQYIPTKPDSIPEQLSQVEDVIVKKPDAIVFIPVDYKALVPAVEKINAAGIPVTNITDRVAGGNLVAYIGADDYNLGLSTGRALNGSPNWPYPSGGLPPDRQRNHAELRKLHGPSADPGPFSLSFWIRRD